MNNDFNCCHCCPKDGDTIDLTDCQIGNVNYPMRCEESKMDWISVEDGLPVLDESVLVLIVYSRFVGGSFAETEEICTGAMTEDGGDDR